MATTRKTIITVVPGKQEILTEREFDAPRELVFKAYTDPKLIVQWLGPRELSLKLDRFDLRSGGSYRYIHKDVDGNAFAFHGVCHEVTAPERIIQTFEFEGCRSKDMLRLNRFEVALGGRTTVTTQSVFQSVADRDDMIQSGMERGVQDSHERLSELLTKMNK